MKIIEIKPNDNLYKSYLKIRNDIFNDKEDIFDLSSKHFLIFSYDGEIIGVFRLIHSLSFFDLSASKRYKLYKCIQLNTNQNYIEISRFGLTSTKRGTKESIHIRYYAYSYIIQYCKRSNIDFAVVAIEDSFSKIIEKTNIHIQNIGPTNQTYEIKRKLYLMSCAKTEKPIYFKKMI